MKPYISQVDDGLPVSAHDALRKQLGSMSLSQLRKRAAGAGDEKLEELLDSDDPKAAYIELILSQDVPRYESKNSEERNGMSVAELLDPAVDKFERFAALAVLARLGLVKLTPEPVRA